MIRNYKEEEFLGYSEDLRCHEVKCQSTALGLTFILTDDKKSCRIFIRKRNKKCKKDKTQRYASFLTTETTKKTGAPLKRPPKKRKEKTQLNH